MGLSPPRPSSPSNGARPHISIGGKHAEIGGKHAEIGGKHAEIGGKHAEAQILSRAHVYVRACCAGAVHHYHLARWEQVDDARPLSRCPAMGVHQTLGVSLCQVRACRS